MNNVFGPLFPPNVVALVSVSGSFSSTQTQPQLGANTPIAITYNTIETSNGVTFDNTVPSRILVPQDGLYEFNFSIQFDQQAGGTSTFDVWLRKNGVDIPRSNTQGTIAGQQGETFLFGSFFLELLSTDYIEVVYASQEATCSPTAFPAQVAPPDPYTRPAAPSIITTAKLLSV
jgi:hypothetical protein